MKQLIIILLFSLFSTHKSEPKLYKTSPVLIYQNTTGEISITLEEEDVLLIIPISVNVKCDSIKYHRL